MAISSRMRNSSSALPLAKPSLSGDPPSCGIRRRKPPLSRSRSHGRPLAICSSSEFAWYCTDSQTSSMPLLRRFDIGKSTSWYTPPKGSAGLARSRVRTSIRLPLPPA